MFIIFFYIFADCFILEYDDLLACISACYIVGSDDPDPTYITGPTWKTNKPYRINLETDRTSAPFYVTQVRQGRQLKVKQTSGID